MAAQITEALQKLDAMISDAATNGSAAQQQQQQQQQRDVSAAAAGSGSAIATPDGVASIRAELARLFTDSIAAALPAAAGEAAAVAACNNAAHGDYQCNNAMALFGKLKGKVGTRPGCGAGPGREGGGLWQM